MKRMSPTDAIIPGDLLLSGQVLGEPTALLERVFRDARHVDGLRLFVGMGLGKVLECAPENIALMSFVGMGSNAGLLAAGRLSLVPCHMSDLGQMVANGPLRPDVAMVLVSPPDAAGMCNLGVGSDYLWPAIGAASRILAEINPNVPRVLGDTQIPFERLDGYIETTRPLPEYPRACPSATEKRIAAWVAGFVRDGSCIQVGVGRLGEAVLQAVAGHRHLGVHTGMVGETILEMMNAGVITNTRKRVDTGLTVTGAILGGAQAVALAAREPNLRLRAVTYTNSGDVIAGIDDFVSINSAIEVDIFGQINAEVADGRYLGGIGGSVDYMRPAVRSAGGRSLVALPAATRGGVSRIVPRVARVTASRSDVDAVITEHGVAELRGVSEGERARRLIDIAAPQHRETLRDAVRSIGL
jgi:acetyl-CoA hydrolase